MSVPGPVLGPCDLWCDGQDVAECCDADLGAVGPTLLDQVAAEASMALFEISGRQFTGLCGPRTVRPCADRCRCWATGQASRVAASGWGWDSASWRHECGDRCGCLPLSRIRIGGYPVREIVEVRIDGVVVDPSGYRLDGWRYLTRLDDPGPPVSTRLWPQCQNLALDDGEPGMFSITYRWGVDPPELGRRAAAMLACQLYLQCTGGEGCKLPAGVSRVTRQGVTFERGLLINWFDAAEATGLPPVDLFLRAYNCWKTRRRPAVWTPDVADYPLAAG